MKQEYIDALNKLLDSYESRPDEELSVLAAELVMMLMARRKRYSLTLSLPRFLVHCHYLPASTLTMTCGTR
jgi:hypothetical protein